MVMWIRVFSAMSSWLVLLLLIICVIIFFLIAFFISIKLVSALFHPHVHYFLVSCIITHIIVFSQFFIKLCFTSSTSKVHKWIFRVFGFFFLWFNHILYFFKLIFHYYHFIFNLSGSNNWIFCNISSFMFCNLVIKPFSGGFNQC